MHCCNSHTRAPSSTRDSQHSPFLTPRTSWIPTLTFFYYSILPANSGTAQSPKISVMCKFRCPFMYRSIVKRRAMTGSWLGRYVRPASRRVSEGTGGARALWFRSSWALSARSLSQKPPSANFSEPKKRRHRPNMIPSVWFDWWVRTKNDQLLLANCYQGGWCIIFIIIYVWKKWMWR